MLISQSTVVAGGSQLVTTDFAVPNGLLGSGRPPYQLIQLDVEDAIPGQHTTLQIYWGAVLV